MKTQKSPEKRISFEGVPHAIWYAVQIKQRIIYGFIITDHSGFAYDDSDWSHAMVRLQPGDLIRLYWEDDRLWPSNPVN